MRSAVLRGLILLVPLLMAACATAPSLPADGAKVADFRTAGLGPGDLLEVTFFPTGTSATEAYRIRPGDVLGIQVFGHPEISRNDVLVLPDGSVALDGVPFIKAASLTPQELASVLTGLYKERQLRNPIVSIALKSADLRVQSLTEPSLNMNNRFQITLDQSGAIDLPFIDPIAATGTIDALQRDVSSAYEKEFGGLIDVTVNLRDRLPPRVLVAGEVNMPGAVPYRRPMTAFMAVAGAGGFSTRAKASEVRLLRVGDDGLYRIVPLNLRRGFEGQLLTGGDIALNEQDIIYVPATGVAITNTRIEQYIRKMLPTAVGFGVSYDANQ